MMASVKYLAAVAAISLMPTAQCAAEQNIEWVETVHDFGAIDEDDGPVTCSLRFVNHGAAPVAVTSARASCGCTTPRYSTSPVEPSDTGTVEVTFDPTGRPGRFDKKVRIDTSDGEGEPLRSSLRIKGVVVGASNTIRSRYPVDAGPVKLRTSTAAFGEVMDTREKACYIECYNASTDTVVPYWSGLPPYITARSFGAKLAPGEQKTFTLRFSGPKSPLYGVVSDEIFFHADEAAEPVAVDAIALVCEDFTRLTPGARANAPEAVADPEIVDFGEIARDGGPVSRTFDVANRGKSPMALRRVYTGDRGVNVAADRSKVKKGKHATVTVTVDPSALPSDLLNARVTVITNDPLRPTVTVRASGMVK